MKRFGLLVLILTAGVFGQFVPTISSATSDDASSLALNPAGLGVERNFNMWILGPMDFSKLDTVQNDASFYVQVGRSGFGFTHYEEGIDLFHWGSGEHVWKGIHLGSTSHFSSDGFEAVDLGLLYRGFPWFSAGLEWKNAWARQRRGSRPHQTFDIGLAVRPFGNRFTLAYDYRFSAEAETFNNGTDMGSLIQFQSEPVDGLKLFASYDTRERGIQLGIGIGFGTASLESYHDLDKSSNYMSSLMGVHISKEMRRTVGGKKKSTFVELSFERPVSDSPSPRALFGPRTITLKELIDEIHELAENRDVDGIILKPDQYATGLGMMEEVYWALRGFKESGKRVFAFIDMAGDAQYALACVADSVFLNSGGILNIDGIAFGLGFLKGLLDKIGVEAQFYRRGDYKTAAEPYTRENLSETSREAYEAVLEDMQRVFSRMIGNGRGWSNEKVERVYASALFTPPMALKAGLIDGIFHPDQIEKKLEKITGDEVKIVKAREMPKQWVYDWESYGIPKIAIIYAEGPIVPGKSRPSPFGGGKVIGSETTTKAIRKAREDKSVKAIVMRVNSPGGSVLASEDIWREVHRTTHPDSSDKENQKPFIISMADVAGSGGYYISCAADTIVADSSCITGSIGVLTGKLSFGGLFEKIGYNVDVVKEQPHADMGFLHRALTDEEGEAVQAIVDSYYEQFLERVAEGRSMTRDQVDAIAQGRIWSGIDAKERGLVDELGGLGRALEIARDMAGLEEGQYQLEIYKGVERPKFTFNMETRSDLVRLVAAFEDDIPLARMLDRAKLIHDEEFLYLMDAELMVKD